MQKLGPFFLVPTWALCRECALQLRVVQQLDGEDEHVLGGHVIVVTLFQAQFERHPGQGVTSRDTDSPLSHSLLSPSPDGWGKCMNDITNHSFSQHWLRLRRTGCTCWWGHFNYQSVVCCHLSFNYLILCQTRVTISVSDLNGLQTCSLETLRPRNLPLGEQIVSPSVSQLTRTLFQLPPLAEEDPELFHRERTDERPANYFHYFNAAASPLQ